jgi:hypothetical protein
MDIDQGDEVGCNRIVPRGDGTFTGDEGPRPQHGAVATDARVGAFNPGSGFPRTIIRPR